MRELQDQIQLFIRQFGLLNRDETPCGQPIATSQAHALQVLGQLGHVTQQMLSDHLGLDKSTTSRLISQMTERGWVLRGVNPVNRREARVSLTDKGIQMLDQVTAASTEKYQSLWESIPVGKRAQVIESLALLTATLKEKSHR